MHQRLCICTTVVQRRCAEGASQFPSDRI